MTKISTSKATEIWSMVAIFPHGPQNEKGEKLADPSGRTIICSEWYLRSGEKKYINFPREGRLLLVFSASEG